MKQVKKVYPTEAELVKAVEAGAAGEAGSNKAFETLMGKYYVLSFGCLHFRLHDYAHEQDIYQDACVKALMEIREHRHDCSLPFWPWFKSVIINTIIDEARRDKLFVHHQERTIGHYSENPSHNKYADDVEFRELVYQWTAHLPERMRNVMRMKLLDDCLDEEIAEQLNISIGNVRVAKCRAKKKAEKEMHLTALQKLKLGMGKRLKKKKKFQPV
jgi:RNA polymerase sigma factor (sigma-70 family)